MRDCNCSQKHFGCWGWYSGLCLRWCSGNKEDFNLSCTTPGKEQDSGKGYFLFSSTVFIVQSSSPLLFFLLIHFSFCLKKNEPVQVKIMYDLSSTVFSSQRGLKRFLSPKGSLFHPYVKCSRSVLSCYIILLLGNNFTILVVQIWTMIWTMSTHFNQVLWHGYLIFNLQKLSILSIKRDRLTNTVDSVMCH